MGKPHPETSASLVPRGVGAELQPARRPKGGWETGSRFVSVMLAMLLAVTMMPAAGLSSAYADEPVERPATSGGDVALSGMNGAATASQTPVAETREDGMHVADGLAYTVADGGLALVGFDGDAPAGALVVPAAVMIDGKETPVVAIDLAEGQAADEVVTLSLPQGIKNINTASLASAFPALLSVEVAGASSSLPVAAGAASMRAAYSTSGGMVFRPATVDVQGEEGTLAETVECKELLWAPPALAVARIPVECRAIAEGAFANVRDLRAIVTFGTMARIAERALTSEQISGAKVVVPNESPAVVDEGTERVSANMALMNDEGQMERRRPWHEAGFASDDIVMGKPYGSLTETVAVAADGTVASSEARLISYPGMHPEATDVKHPGEDGKIDMAESGLAFTVKSDMTASVAWQGDKTATPAHIDIPSSVVIDDVTYPVTEIAAGAFEGAAFLTSVTIPEGVTTIGDAAFANCANLTKATFPVTLKTTGIGSFDGTQVEPPTLATATRVPLAASGDAAQSDGATGTADDASPSPDADGAHSRPDGEEPPSGDNLTTSSDDSISSYTLSTTGTALNIEELGTSASHLTIDCSSGTLSSSVENRRRVYTSPSAFSAVNVYTGNVGWGHTHYIKVALMAASGVVVSSLTLTADSGFVMSGVSFHDSGFLKSDGSVGSRGLTPVLFVTLARVESGGDRPLATTDLLSKSGETAFSSTSTVRGALNDLSSLLSKPDEQPFNSTATVRTNLIQLNAKFSGPGEKAFTSTDTVRGALNAKVDASDFGTIAYSGLDGADMSVFPTSYRKGGAPALPKPEKPGSRFAGWTWSGHATPTTDPNEIKTAFADGNKTVTLTANWTAPEATYFFTEDKPLDPLGTGTQEHDIFVKLSDSPGRLTKFNLKCDNSLGLFTHTDVANGFTFDLFNGVGPVVSGQSVNTEIFLGSGKLMERDGIYGLFLRIRIPQSALNPSAFPSSLVSGSSVLECFEFEYVLA